MESSSSFVPYKSVSGTSGKLVTGIAYQIIGKFGHILDVVWASKPENQKGYLKLAGNGETPEFSNTLLYLDEAGEFYRIKTPYGHILDVEWANKNKGKFIPVHANGGGPFYDNTLFSIISASDGYYQIKGKFGHYLDIEGANQNKGKFRHVYGNGGTPLYENSLFKFVPVCYTLNTVISDFVYEGNLEKIKEKHQKPVDLVTKHVIPNQSAAELTETISQSKTVTSSISFGFKESFQIGSKVEISGGIPFGASAKAEMSLTMGFEANQQITETKTVTFQIQKTIKVPPYNSLEVCSYVNYLENCEIPFSATIKITGLADRFKTDDTIAKSLPIEGEGLISFLKYNNYQGKIIKVDNFAVYANITGTFTGSFGLDSVFSAKNI